jgi:hypothetical protein
LNYGSYQDGLASGAALLGRPDLKHQAGGFREEALWLFGPDAAENFEKLEAQPPVEQRKLFKEAGYWISRSGWSLTDTHLVFDCGGLGAGSGGHGHSDALSFSLFSGGHAFLIDPGTSVYNAAPEWRRFFRSTAAHNAVLVDGAGQSQPGGTFRWTRRASVVNERDIALPEIEYVGGSVEFRGAGAITHRRRLVHIRPDYWIVLDTLNGVGEHDFDFLYHFAPDVQLTILSDEKRGGDIDCRARVGSSAFQLYMYASDAVRAEALCGQSGPAQGWASRLYGDRRASPVLKAGIRAQAPVAMASFLVPADDSISSQRFKANSNHAIAAAMRYGENDDIIVTAVEDGDLRLLDYRMRGGFFWLRTEQGCLRRLFATDAYTFVWGSETVFESRTPIPYVHAYFWENGIVIERGDNEGKVYVRDLRDRQFQRN